MRIILFDSDDNAKKFELSEDQWRLFKFLIDNEFIWDDIRYITANDDEFEKM